MSNNQDDENERLRKQIEFIIEADKLKSIYRQTFLMNGSRNENSAEHSWHLGIMAILLADHSFYKDIDILRVLKMVLIHDIVEIDAGDTFCYDAKKNEDKREREEKAADRIFRILPLKQAEELRDLWEEFEEMKTHEAKFAASLDRLQPLIHNYFTNGASWMKHGVTAKKVIERNRHMKNGSPVLWQYANKLIEESIKKGYLRK